MSTRNVLSAKHLATAVNQAAEAAAKRHKLEFAPAYAISGLINGRVLRELADLNAASQAATEIAAEASKAAAAAGQGAVAAPKVHLPPAILVRPGGPIICGFILDPAEVISFE